ncbi:MAG: alpha/beta hydrolase [Actinomycetota bacterium]
MPLDPAAEFMITFLTDAGLTFTPGASPRERREAMRSVMAGVAVEPLPVGAVRDEALPGPAGPVPVRIYEPVGPAPDAMLLWFHGGGWVTGDLDTHDQLCRQLCLDAGVVVASVDYRLAPEAKFPAAADDCLAAYEWAIGRAKAVAVGGDSAGGNLAAVVALDARDRGLRAPAAQVLVYPVADHEFESPAMVDNAKGYFLEAEGMRWFYECYARSEADTADPRFSPIRAADHAGLAPAVVVTAEYDPLRDQGAAYAEKLRAAGVPVEYLCADGLIHGYFGMHALMPAAQAPWDAAIRLVRTALGAEDVA